MRSNRLFRAGDNDASIWNILLFILFVLAALMLAGGVRAGDIYVDAGFGDNWNSGSDWGTAKRSIAAAIDEAAASASSPVIRVAAGTYAEVLNFTAATPGITIVGGYPAGGGERNLSLYRTTIKPSTDWVPSLAAVGTRDLTIDGVNFQDGGHLRIADSTNVTIRNSVIQRNKVRAIRGRDQWCDGLCGGLCDATPVAAEWGYGGGLEVVRSSVTIVNNLVTDNVIESYDPAPCRPGVDIAAGGAGAGLYINDATGLIASNTITGNEAQLGWDGTGIGSSGAHLENVGARLTFRDNIVWGAVTGIDFAGPPASLGAGFEAAYCDLGETVGEVTGPGNFSADPLLVAGPDGVHFLSQVTAEQPADSPCLDAGSGDAVGLGHFNAGTRTDGGRDLGIVDLGFHLPLAERLRVLAVDPPIGPSLGGNVVRVHGVGFAPTTTIDIDNLVVSTTFISAGLLEVIAPAHPHGASVLRAANSGDVFDTSSYGFCGSLSGDEGRVSGLTIADDAGGTLRFNWDAATPAGGYRVVRAGRKDMSDTLGYQSVAGPATSTTERDAATGIRFYRVTAIADLTGCP